MGKKGIIVEQIDDSIIVLFDDGSYEKIKTNRPLHVGELYEHRTWISYGRVAIAAVLIFCVLFSIDFFTATAYAQLSSGINLGVNRWNRVISIEATSEEAKELVEELSITGKSYDEVISQIIKKSLAKEEGRSKNELTLKVESKNKRLENELKNKFSITLQKANHNRETFGRNIKGETSETTNNTKSRPNIKGDRSNGKEKSSVNPPKNSDNSKRNQLVDKGKDKEDRPLNQGLPKSMMKENEQGKVNLIKENNESIKPFNYDKGISIIKENKETGKPNYNQDSKQPKENVRINPYANMPKDEKGRSQNNTSNSSNNKKD